jgi:hypothetical protein
LATGLQALSRIIESHVTNEGGGDGYYKIIECEYVSDGLRQGPLNQSHGREYIGPSTD